MHCPTEKYMARRHSFHPRLHYIHPNAQIYFFCDSFPFFKEMWWHDIIFWTQYLTREHWLKFHTGNNRHPRSCRWAIIPPIDFSTVNIFSEKNLICPDASFFKEHNSRLQQKTRLVLAASESICCIFNMYDMYRRSSSSAIRCIVGSLIPIIDPNFLERLP